MEHVRATLFYKSYCPPCQWMSKLAVMLALGSIKRVPIEGDEANSIYEKYREHQGQLILVKGNRVTFGRLVFAEIPRTIIIVWWHLIRAVLRMNTFK